MSPHRYKHVAGIVAGEIANEDLPHCFTAIDYFELREVPFIVAVNAFDGAPRFHPSRCAALDLDPHVPVVICDARDRTSCRDVLLALIAHLRRLQEGAYGQRATL
jgi:hypothetical protein